MTSNITDEDRRVRQEMKQVFRPFERVLVDGKPARVTGYATRSRQFFVTFVDGPREKVEQDRIELA